MNNAKTSNYVAIGMMAAGFLLIVLGWNGAAGKDYVQGQLPYVISGGLAGVALIAAGLTLLIVMELRRNTAALQQQLTELTQAVESMGGPVDEASVEGLTDRQRRALERAGRN